MRGLSLSAAIATVASAAAAVWFLLHGGLGLQDLPTLMIDSGLVVKTAGIMTVFVMVPTLVLAAAALASRRSNVVLPLLGALALGFGALGCAYGLLTIRIAIDRIGPVSSEVYAPSVVEALIPLSVGLATAAVAFAVAAATGRRSGAGSRDVP